MSDLDAIMRIEHAGFTPQEAASRISMAARITNYPDTFIVARLEIPLWVMLWAQPLSSLQSQMIFLRIVNLNQPAAPTLRFSSLAVAPNMQHHGIGRQLLAKLTQVAQLQNALRSL